jgi:membrane protein
LNRYVYDWIAVMPAARHNPMLELAAIGAVAATAFAAAYFSRSPAASRADHGKTSPLGPSEHQPLAVQHVRSMEPGRGRGATSPWQMPWAAWKDIFIRTYEEMNNDRLLALAAGVVFYSLLAMFPAVTAGVSLYGLFADARVLSEHLTNIAGIIPAGAVQIVGDQITRIVQTGGARLTLGFIFGLGLALWSANAGMKAMFDALNVIYDEEEKRGFIKLNIVSLTFTICAIAVALLLASGVLVAPILFSYFGMDTWGEVILAYGRWPLMFLVTLTLFAMLYRFGPSRTAPQWRWLSVGGVLGSVVWLIGSAAFSYYLANFGNYDATYGSLGAAVGLMMWMWLSVIVILLGAELNSEVEHQTAKDTTLGVPKPMGTRGAVMADTVGAARTSLKTP